MSDWNNLVQKIYNENKHKKGFKLKNAMKMASPIWKNSKKNYTSQKTKRQKRGKRRSRGTRRR